MRSTSFAITLTLLTTACASTAGKAPACSGPHRPANPYGSVLAPTDAKAPAPASADGAAPPCGSPR